MAMKVVFKIEAECIYVENAMAEKQIQMKMN